MAPCGKGGNLDLYRRLDLINIIMSQIGLIHFDIMVKQEPHGRDDLYLDLYLGLRGTSVCTVSQPPTGRDDLYLDLYPERGPLRSSSMMAGASFVRGDNTE